MINARRILVVVNRADEAGYVLDKAATLAQAEHASVQIIRIVYDDLVDFRHTNADDTQAMKLFIMQSEEGFLVSVVDDYRSRFKDIETFTVWNKRVSEGAIHAAEKFDADLIIKAVDATSPVFPRHPDDWNLMRHAGRQVMLVSPHPWRANPTVLAAVDLLDDAHDDLNDRILKTGGHVAAELDGLLHVVCAYPGMTTWANADVNLAVDYMNLEGDVVDSAKSHLDQLTETEFDARLLHIKSGNAVEVVREVVDELKPEVVVIGTAAREGVQGFIMGNTSEALLGAIESDLLVVAA